jgi:SAM-dependent methyltransferase
MWSIYDHIRLLSRWDRAVGLIKSIQDAVRQNDRVLDAGCGLGICSFLAVKSGASQVIGVDRDPVDLAQKLADENSLTQSVSFIQADLRNLSLPEHMNKFDVLISLIYNNDPRRDELQSQIVLELCKKYLKPASRIVPDRVRYLAYACDWQAFDIKRKLLSLERYIIEMQGRYNLSFESLRSTINEQADGKFFPVRDMGTGRIGTGNQYLLLSGPEVFCEIDYYKDFSSYPSSFRLTISTPGRMNTILWVQELWYRDTLIFSNESVSYIKNAKSVEPGEAVTVICGEEWRKSNIAGLDQ